jgi:hypothetical protein
MTLPGENRSIYFDGDRLAKIERIIALYEQKTGIKPTRSQIVNRAIDFLFSSECPSDRTDAIAKDEQVAV